MKLGLVSLLCAGLAAAPSSATIVSGTLTGGSSSVAGGQFLVITPPSAIVADGYNNNDVRGFNEKQDVSLGTSLSVDGGTIAAGTLVSSHYINFDPVNASVTGTITFATNVLGVISTSAELSSSDFLGVSTTNYALYGLRGLEAGVDSVSFSGNTVSYSLFTSSPGDNFRVITAQAVPEPATWAMFIGGFGLVGAGMRRRRQIGAGLA